MSSFSRRLLCAALVLAMFISLLPAALAQAPVENTGEPLGITLMDNVNTRYEAGKNGRLAFTLPKDWVCIILGTKVVMIVDTPEDFDWQKAMDKLATLPRQAEWEAFVAKLQGCRADARSDEKWQMMERMFHLYD